MKVVRFVAPDRTPYVEGLALLSKPELHLFSGDSRISCLLWSGGGEYTIFEDTDLPDEIKFGNGLLVYREGDRYFYPHDCKHCVVIEELKQW